MECETKSSGRTDENGNLAPMHDMSYFDRSVPADVGETYRKSLGKDMFERAKARRDSMIYDAKTYDELKTLATTKDGGFIKINWCGNVECENKIKDEFGIKSRCLIENEKITGPCTVCGKEAKTRLYIGRQY